MPTADTRTAAREASRPIARLHPRRAHASVVEFVGTRGRVPLDAASSAIPAAGPARLHVRIDTDDAAGSARKQGVVAAHPHRVARGEQPLRTERTPGAPDVA